MVKHGNNPSGKSDKHQLHGKKYALTHLESKLERWYTKVTTPKAIKPKDIKKTCNIPVDLARAREIRECIKAFKREHGS